MRVVASVDGNGIRPERRYQRIPVTRLKAKNLDPQLLAQEICGYRPSGIATTFAPKLSKPTHQLRVGRGKDSIAAVPSSARRSLSVRRPLVPVADDRQSADRREVGVRDHIGPRHVLTASHVVNWTGGSEGGVAWLTFTPGYFDGSGPWGEIAATRVIYWEQAPGTLTDQQTAFDYVVLVMDQRIGDVVGYPGYRTYDDGLEWRELLAVHRVSRRVSSGERPAFQGKGVISTVAERRSERPDGLRAGPLQRVHTGPVGRIASGAGGTTNRGHASSGSEALSATQR